MIDREFCVRACVYSTSQYNHSLCAVDPPLRAFSHTEGKFVFDTKFCVTATVSLWEFKEKDQLVSFLLCAH
jgi:hypothetical protein